MKNTKKNKLPLSGCIVVLVILFAFSNLMVDLNIDTDVLRIFFAALGIGIIIYGFIADQKENMTLKKNIEILCWNDPDSRSFQEIYESVCKTYVIKIKDVRKELLYRTIFIILITVALILLMLYIEKVEPIFFIIPVYVILQMAIVIINEKKERYYYGKILKEFVESCNQDNYNFNYVERVNRAEFYRIKSIIKEDYKEFDDISNYCYVKDCIEGEISENVPMRVAQVRSSYSIGINNSHLLYDGSFFCIDKNTNVNIKILFDKRGITCNEKDLILVDNQSINKYYEIYSDNKESANKFLTIDLLNFIAEFREKHEIKFEIIFKDKIYIKFYTKNLFNKEGMTEKEIDKVSAGEYFLMIKFANELLEKLNNI